MITPHTSHSKHHLRFYIVTATLIIGGILFLLSLNNNGSNFSLTSAIVGVANDTLTLDGETFQVTKEPTVEDVIKQEAKETDKTVPVLLSFDQIPKVEKKAKIEKVSLRFDDVTTTVIKLNNDKLELNNLDTVDLDIEDFKGEVDFDASGLSMDGTAARIEVNKVAFSSPEDIKLSFQNLRYKTLEIDELELEDIDFPVGDGNLEVTGKLTYNIQQESMDIYYFLGKLSINKDDIDTGISLDGVARSVGINGESLSLNLR